MTPSGNPQWDHEVDEVEHGELVTAEFDRIDQQVDYKRLRQLAEDAHLIEDQG